MSYRFLVDTPLGKLARWLRILGFDSVYVKETQNSKVALNVGGYTGVAVILKEAETQS